MKTITVGELRRKLEELLAQPDHAEVFFGGGDLSFYRLKNRGPRNPADGILYQVEFNELYEVTLDPDASPAST